MTGQRKILIIVEGEKRDFLLMKHLLNIYGIEETHEVYSYNTGIYALFNQMFRDRDPSSLDILQVLKESEKDEEKRKLLSERYTDILLVFDLDPHDTFFTPQAIKLMSDYFVESSDMGKLYINYPMVEAFYHMKSIPDPDYNSYVSSMDELKAGKYKRRVSDENRNHNYKKFAVNKAECNTVINQNIDKAKLLTAFRDEEGIPSENDILKEQLVMLNETDQVSVLSTCGFYIYDYNPDLLS